MSSIDSQETSNEETKHDRREASSSERQAGGWEGRQTEGVFCRQRQSGTFDDLV
jgi:hypothetical protein